MTPSQFKDASAGWGSVHGSPSRRLLLMAAGIVALALAWVAFEPVRETAWFVLSNLIAVLPLIIPGIIVAGWVAASGAGTRVADKLSGNTMTMIVVASAIGAVTPVCGVTVIPLMAALLSSGIPLAPVMAFWLSSPITDPAMIAATMATLGIGFAVGKTLAAFALGLLGGFATMCVGGRIWTINPLRSNSIVGRLGSDAGCGDEGVEWRVWNDKARMKRFRDESLSMTRLVLVCLIPAFAAEHLLHAILDPQSLSRFVGDGSPWSVPIAVLFGSPIYLEGFAALPLVRGLMDHGMSAGAALAFMVSGGAVSVWGAMAIAPVLRLQPFILYLVVAVVGSVLVGWAFGFVA